MSELLFLLVISTIITKVLEAILFSCESMRPAKNESRIERDLFGPHSDLPLPSQIRLGTFLQITKMAFHPARPKTLSEETSGVLIFNGNEKLDGSERKLHKPGLIQ